VKLWCEESGVAEPNMRSWGSVPSFLAELDKIKAAILTAEDFGEAARVFVHDEAADGVVWTETQLYPYSLGTRCAPDVLVDAVLDGLRRGAKETGIGAGLILTINRTKALAEAVQIAKLAAERADAGVVGLGMADREDEDTALASTFREAFDLVAGTSLLRVPHAGEGLGPDGIRDALSLKPHRIMHGIRAQEDPELFRWLADAGITLDTAPTSNIELGIIPDLERFPARAMLDAGVKFTISADGLLMFRSTATLELHRVAIAHKLTRSEIAVIAESSLLASAAPHEVANTHLDTIRSWAVAS
jgi:adenosine deaminase